MRWALSLLWRDWIRAPISGTLVIASQIVCGILFWRGEVDRGLLVLILSSIWLAQRGPMEDEE
jgi:hypothetical protein